MSHKQRRFFIITVSIAVIGLFFTALFVITDGKRNAAVPLPVHALPELVFKNYDGQEVHTGQFKGRPMLINAWASWCPFCEREFVDFVALQKEFGDRIVIIAVNRGEPLDAARTYTDGLGITKDLLFVLDQADSFYRSVGGFSMPESVFVDASGIIRDHKRGPMDALEMHRRVEQAFSL